MKKTYALSFGIAVLLIAALFTLAGCPNPGGGGDDPVAVTGVTLNRTALTLAVGGSETLIATVSPANAANKAVIWSSSDTTTATVSADGLVTLIKAGSATITVTTADGGFTAFCTVTDPASPPPVAVTGVTLNRTALTLTVGGSETLIATVSPANAANKAVTWSSSDTTTATVGTDGLVTLIKAGSATITVTTVDGGFTASCTVAEPASPPPVAVTGVTLNKTALTLAIGGSETLIATVSPANAANKAVTWSSSDTTTATVSADGLVTLVKAGSATITVTTADGGFTAFCTVTNPASPPPVAVTGVTLNKTALTLTVGGSETLIATVSPANAANKAVTWSSSDTTTATVSADGLVTLIKAASATITVTTADGGFTASCTMSSFKPKKLSTSTDWYTGTRYETAVAKLDEIITYCSNNPGTVNDIVLSNAIQLKTGMSAYQNTWDSSGNTAIGSINNLIGTIVGYEAPHLSVLNLPADWDSSRYSEVLITTTTLSQTSSYDTLSSDSNTKWKGKRLDGIFYPDWPASTNFTGTFNVFVKVIAYQFGGPDPVFFSYQNNVSFNTNGQVTTIDWDTMTPLDN